ncbi:hypothetical protein EVAR_51535_1 [Eumeta japonica]|uniref:Reverse transcriptase domain-containing protein n=1 Tax=Eumeta variegata TaxID=151549 RepID=A0A4C1XDC6_EUMVA|nr:hypothetical protein EVAR_51535_1 [Eumeta japonica]
MDHSPSIAPSLSIAYPNPRQEAGNVLLSIWFEEYECELRMGELSVRCVLYADDQVILALSTCELQEKITKMKNSVKKVNGVKVNASKSKVIVFERG